MRNKSCTCLNALIISKINRCIENRPAVILVEESRYIILIFDIFMSKKIIQDPLIIRCLITNILIVLFRTFDTNWFGMDKVNLARLFNTE